MTIDTVGDVVPPVLPVPVLDTVTVKESKPIFPAASNARMEMLFEPACRGTDAVQFVNPLATPTRRIVSFCHLTCVTATLSDAVPLSESDEAFVEYVDPLVGEVIVTVGLVESGPLVDGGGVVVVPPPVDDVVLERVTSSLSVLGLPAPSYAVISIGFDPARRGMLAIVQLVVPLATPLTPLGEISHTTRVMADDALPLRVMLDCEVEKDVSVVGAQIDTVEVAQLVGVVVVPPVLLLVDDVVIVHVKVCGVLLNTPSDARAVTVYVPAVVPVPEI